MNVRERFHATLNFKQPDRLPIIEWATWWDTTVNNWKREGLVIPPVEGLDEWQALQRYWGLDLNLQSWIGFRTGATPAPAYHGAPIVRDETEYERILPTLYPAVEHVVDVARLKTYAEWQRMGEAVVWLTLEGAFWGPRTLLGIEGHLYDFYDQPELMHRINRDIFDFNLRILDEVCKYVTPDFMTIAEDMSYNGGPMISHAQFNEFMLPYYKMLVPELKRHGIRVLVDSDGDVTEMVPWLISAGVEGILPLERQAGVEIASLRRDFPEFLCIGHFDKMTMPRGREAMRAEFERLLPTMKKGGFIPSVDHQTPPSVTMEQYKDYISLLGEYAALAAKK
jgi:Uroporphyrinogen-III decarboxylase